MNDAEQSPEVVWHQIRRVKGAEHSEQARESYSAWRGWGKYDL
jgi:hypothetical protein